MILNKQYLILGNMNSSRKSLRQVMRRARRVTLIIAEQDGCHGMPLVRRKKGIRIFSFWAMIEHWSRNRAAAPCVTFRPLLDTAKVWRKPPPLKIFMLIFRFLLFSVTFRSESSLFGLTRLRRKPAKKPKPAATRSPGSLFGLGPRGRTLRRRMTFDDGPERKIDVPKLPVFARRPSYKSTHFPDRPKNVAKTRYRGREVREGH